MNKKILAIAMLLALVSVVGATQMYGGMMEMKDDNHDTSMNQMHGMMDHMADHMGDMEELNLEDMHEHMHECMEMMTSHEH